MTIRELLLSKEGEPSVYDEPSFMSLLAKLTKSIGNKEFAMKF